MTLTGKLIPTLEPGSKEWSERMSASKVAAALGLSPWESPYSLWHKMAGTVDPEPMTGAMRRGHYLEPAIRNWFADQHPDWHVTEGGTWENIKNQWMIASPDSVILPAPDADAPHALLEVKTAADDYDWGKPGTDEIPIYYRVQVLWQMMVTGVHTTHVSVLTTYLDLREYTVHYDDNEARTIYQAASDFMDTIKNGQAPPIDGSNATYQTVRRLHTDIEDDTVELPYDIANAYCKAKHALAAAKTEDRRATSDLAAYIGAAKRASYGGRVIATRNNKDGGAPYIAAGRKLPATLTATEDNAA